MFESINLIADADTHISGENTGKRINAEELLRRMQKLRINKALIWLHPNQSEDEYCDEDAQNAYIAGAASRFPGTLLPMGWINPRKLRNRAEIRSRVRQLTEEYGFYGIKLNGAQNYYDLADVNLVMPAVEEIAKAGCVLAFHSDSGSNTRPEKIGSIAGSFPETRILMVHMGQTANDEAIEAARQHPNITLIGSGMKDYGYVAKACSELGTDRVCFGSDAPFGNMRTVLAAYEKAIGTLHQADLAKIMGGNLLRVLGADR